MDKEKSSIPTIPQSTSRYTLGIHPIEAVVFAILAAIAVSFLQPPPSSPSLQLQWPYYLRIATAIYLIIELLFYIYGKIRYTVLNRPITQFPDAKRVQIAMERFLDLHHVFHLDEFLSGWFLGASNSSILRGNVEEFVAYGFFCQKHENLSSEQLLLIQNFLSSAEERWNITFPPGKNTDLRYMAHVWEPLRVQHKLFSVYMSTEFAAKVAHLLLRWMGFKKGRQGTFTSWTTMNNAAVSGTRNNNNNNGGGKYRGEMKKKENTGHHSPEEKKESLHEETAAASAAVAVAVEKSPGRVAAHNMKEAAHNAAEHALDAAVAATSIAAASMAKQYPHEGQQYHLPSPRPRKSTFKLSGMGSVPLIRSFKEISSMMERRVDLPGSPPPRKGPPSSKPLGSARGGEIKEEHRRQQENLPKSTVPVVFLHGVGFGTLPYLHFIRSLMKACPQSPYILLEMPHVALRLCREAEAVDDVATAAVAAVHKLGFKQACFVGHSYGTFCISRIVQLYPEAVHSTALLDPVCMMTCYPQLLYNFIYRKFVLSDLLSSFLAAVDGVRFLCSRDLTISQAFCRRFHWSELMLWPEDLPRERYRSLIVLSGKDDLVPGELVQIQFDVAEHPARVLYHPELGHGGLLLDSQWMGVVVSGVKKLVYRDEEEGEKTGVRIEEENVGES
jgi:pimeloyl-ACP methyl ester carboxylesterase